MITAEGRKGLKEWLFGNTIMHLMRKCPCPVWVIKLLQKHPLDDLKSEVYLLKGDAGALISELAQSKAIDLIVMGTVSRTGIAG